MTAATMGGRGYLDAVFGPGTSALMPEEAADYLSKAIEDDPQAIGRALSDFAYVDEGAQGLAGVVLVEGAAHNRMTATKARLQRLRIADAELDRLGIKLTTDQRAQRLADRLGELREQFSQLLASPLVEGCRGHRGSWLRSGRRGRFAAAVLRPDRRLRVVADSEGAASVLTALVGEVQGDQVKGRGGGRRLRSVGS